jgi:hypothetical protein
MLALSINKFIAKAMNVHTVEVPCFVVFFVFIAIAIKLVRYKSGLFNVFFVFVYSLLRYFQLSRGHSITYNRTINLDLCLALLAFSSACSFTIHSYYELVPGVFMVKS